MTANKDFKLKNNDKVIKWIFIGIILFICIGALANWIATSFGTFDDDMSAIFYKAMDTPFFRGWSGYTIMDGYLTVMAYIIPAGLLIVESALLYIKKYQPNIWLSQHERGFMNWVIGIVGVIFEIAVNYSFYYWNWKDQGFGNGFDVEFIIGKEYTIPSWIVSVVLANVVFWGLNYWFHWKLVKRPDFLQLKVWRPIATSLMYMAVGYIVVQYTKSGIDRPYWYNVHFTDGLVYQGADPQIAGNSTSAGGYEIKGVLERFREIYPHAFDHYLANGGGRGWLGNKTFGPLSWWPDSWNGHTGLRNWRWWMKGQGIPMSGGAFPSGHMIATAVIALSPTYIFVAKSNSKKYNILKWAAYSLAIIYLLDMAFALQISASHWWSDTTFSLGFAPVFYAIGWGIAHGFCAACNKIFHTTNY